MLYLSQEDYQKILTHCRQGLPNESCGLIGGTKDGDKKEIKKVYLLTNLDQSNEHFSMDPKEQLAAVKDMRANGYVLLGNFHSHPESPSRPSEEDKRLGSVVTICPPLNPFSITTWSSIARCAYTAADNPAGPLPIMIRSFLLSSIVPSLYLYCL